MRILDVLTGRTRPVEANLDSIFGLSGAAITLEAAENLESSGSGGVCYKPAAGQPFAQSTDEFRQLLSLSEDTKVQESTDEYGYHWIVVSNGDFQSLVTDVHMVNSTLQDQGFGPQLLCSVFGFRPKPAGQLPGSSGPAGALGQGGGAGAAGTGGAGDGGAPPPASVYLVYLYKRGAFYPFIPLPGKERHDLESELRLQQVLADDLKFEPDKERWMPIWGLPVR